jgi:hypothetical protein
MAITGLSARYLQYTWVLAITLGWHTFVPFLVLRYVDKLSLRESIAFLGLDRVDWGGLFLVLPIYFVLFALISLPYQKFVAPVIETGQNPYRSSAFQLTASSKTRRKLCIAFHPLLYCSWALATLSAKSCIFAATNEKVRVSGASELGCEFGSFCSLSSLAGSANLANGGAGVGVWTSNDASQGSLRFNCISFLGEHVDGLRTRLGQLLDVEGCSQVSAIRPERC